MIPGLDLYSCLSFRLVMAEMTLLIFSYRGAVQRVLTKICFLMINILNVVIKPLFRMPYLKSRHVRVNFL